MNISASVTVVDKFGDGEEDWRHGEEEVVVWSNGAGKTLQHSKGEALGSSTSEIDVGHPCAGRDSHSRALLIASLANLGISYNVVNIDLAARIMRDLYSEDVAGETLVKAAAIFGMMAGQVIFGTLGDVVGRQLALCYTLLVCFLGAVGSASIFGSGIFHQLVFWRLVLGVGAGGVYPLAATLARASGFRLFPTKVCGGDKSEVDKDTGGTAVALMFSMQGVGHLTARVTGYALVSLLPNNMELAWRLLLGIGAVLPLLLVAAIVSSARDIRYDLMRNGEGGEGGKKEARQSMGTIDGPHSTSLVRMWMALPDKKRLIPKLIGTAGSWFLFDVTFYGNQLYQGDVLEGVFGAAETARAEAAQHTALEMVGLPGYFVTVALVGSMGPRRIQIQGFIVCAILFAGLGLGFEPLKKQPFMLLGLYSLTFFFSNFGPNSTTFMLPSLTFPDQVRGSLNGISAASGKLGAFVGSLFFKAAVTVFKGVGPVLIICALLSLAGGALTTAFVHPEGDGPTTVVADQDTNGDDQDFLELAKGEHGGPDFSRSSSAENSPTPDELSQEHTPINGINRRVEETVEIGKEYGGVGR